VKTQVEEKVEALKKVKDGEDLEAIKKAFDELGEVIQKVGAEMYKAAEGNKASDTKPEDNVEEAKTE
jgi:molecular chaperone DnaK